MTTHLAEAEIHDLADGEISGPARTNAEQHIAACERCARELGSISALKFDLAHLAREDQVGRDVFLAINKRIRTDSVGPRIKRTRLVNRSLIGAAIAASIAGLVLLREPAEETSRPSWSMQIRVGDVGLEIGASEAEYDRALKDLVGEIERRRSKLDPATMALIDDNLRVIDDALRVSRQAIADDGADTETAAHLTAIYQSKLDLLRTVAQLPDET